MACFGRRMLPASACDAGGDALLGERRGYAEPGTPRSPFLGAAVVSIPHERQPSRVAGRRIPINVIHSSNNPSVDLPFGDERSSSDVLSVFSMNST